MEIAETVRGKWLISILQMQTHRLRVDNFIKSPQQVKPQKWNITKPFSTYTITSTIADCC